MAEKRKNNKNVRVSNLTKLILHKASKELGISEVKVVEGLVANHFPELYLKARAEMVGK